MPQDHASTTNGPATAPGPDISGRREDRLHPAANAQTAARMADEGLVSMLSAGLDTNEERRRRIPVVAAMVLTWLGFLAVSGRHLGGPWGPVLWGTIPRPALYVSAVAGLLLLAVSSARARNRPVALLSAMVAAYLAGNLLSGAAHRLLDPRAAIESVWLGFIASRLLYTAAVAAPMALVYLVLFRRRGPFHLGFGDWRRSTRLGRRDIPRTWARTLGSFALVIALPAFLLLQAMVGFAPLTSGRLTALAIPILLMALSNAFAEELLFRGLMQGAAIVAAGPAFGIWSVSILFGLHHWGMSFDVLARLPMALGLGIGSVLFAKSVIETRGLAWAVAAHALVNVCLFSAYYVAAG